MSEPTREVFEHGRYSAESVLPNVYGELRNLAKSRLAGEFGVVSLQATELVHEAYLRLFGDDKQWDGRAHFFAAASEAMRRVLVDRARAKKCKIRGGDWRRVEMTESDTGNRMSNSIQEILLINDLIDKLAQSSPQEAEIAKLCYFADFNVSEAARALEIPTSTAHKRWNFAKAWLRREFHKESESERDS